MGDIIRFGVISDTHGKLPAGVRRAFAGVARIYHCGDLGGNGVREELEALAPVVAVLGNMDSWAAAMTMRETVVEEAPFGRVAIAHGTEFTHANALIAEGLGVRFAEDRPRVVLFGHSHEPFLDRRGGVLFLNPGSASVPHRGEPPTVALLEYDAETGELTARHVALEA